MSLNASMRARLTLPVFGAPMFLVSQPGLAIACAKAGIIGSLTRNHCRDTTKLAMQLKTVRSALDKYEDTGQERKAGPLAVNISPTAQSADFREDLAVCRQYGVDIIVTSVGDPTRNAPLVREYGMLHFHDATTIRHAEKAAAAGVDGIVCIGSGGGGHAGTISHLVFIPRVRAMFSGTIVMAGAISNGAAIRAAEILGADLAYIGTRLIATQEASAPDEYKAMLLDANVNDVIYTRGVNGMAASWLVASLREAGLDPDNLFIPDHRSTAHLPPEKMPWRDIWSAGQGTALIDDIPTVANLILRLQHEYIAACAAPDMADAVRSALDHRA